MLRSGVISGCCSMSLELKRLRIVLSVAVAAAVALALAVAVAVAAVAVVVVHFNLLACLSVTVKITTEPTSAALNNHGLIMAIQEPHGPRDRRMA